jgi:hypothetical protein
MGYSGHTKIFDSNLHLPLILGYVSLLAIAPGLIKRLSFFNRGRFKLAQDHLHDFRHAQASRAADQKPHSAVYERRDDRLCAAEELEANVIIRTSQAARELSIESTGKVYLLKEMEI